MTKLSAEAQIAVRNVGLLLAQRGLHVLGGLLFAVLVPRLMGPEIYGRYALVTSIALWFAMFSGLGQTQVMGRFVPQFTALQDTKGLQKLLGNLLVTRLMNGALAAGLYLLLTSLWSRELDWVVLGVMAAAVFVRTVANLFFALFLGLNQAARWGMGEVLRQWVSLVFLLPGFWLGGLRGACLGLLLSEVVLLGVGIAWAGAHFSWSKLDLDWRFVAPYGRFGLLFFGSTFLLSICQRSGETLLRVVSANYRQVAYYALANGIYLVGVLTIWQFDMAFAPALSSLRARGETEALQQCVERLLKWLAVGTMVAIFGALLIGEDVVPLAFGAAFRPVAVNLLPLTVALLPVALGDVARVLAVTYDRPGVAVTAAGVQLVAFWTLGPPLVAWRASLAACLTVLVASSLYAIYFTWRMRRTVPYSLRPWVSVTLLGALFLPLAWLKSSAPRNFALYAVFLAGYGGALLLLRIVTPGELTTLWRVLRPERSILEPTAPSG